jgi:uncharacterized membrane protein YadS
VLLAPLLIVFALLRRSASSAPELRRSAVAQLPRFVAGFVALAVARALGDHFLAGAAVWHAMLAVDHVLVDVTMMTVAAGIGLHLGLRGLLTAGPRALLLGAVGASSMAALTLSLVMLGQRGGPMGELMFGGLVLAAAYFAYRAATASTSRVARSLEPGRAAAR